MNIVKAVNVIRQTYKLPVRYCNIYTSFNVNSAQFQSYVNKLTKDYANLQGIRNLRPDDLKRFKHLSNVMSILEHQQKLRVNLTNLQQMEQTERDKEMLDLIKTERSEFENSLSSINEELVEALLYDEDADVSSIVLEVTAGVGGQEAMLFAKEMFDMYQSFINFKGWSWQLAQYDSSETAGLRHGTFLVDGHGVFSELKYEAGVHRVQRVPATEKSGRIHTSTVSVAILPQPNEITINLKDKDLKIETKKSSGAGGQHVNTTDTAVRIVHLPTNTSVECQTERSQILNREIALKRLKAKLYQQQLDEIDNETRRERKMQVGSSLRNEKIRTYNFIQDRVTDHRIENATTHNLRGLMHGEKVLEQFIDTLKSRFAIKILLEQINSVQT